MEPLFAELCAKSSFSFLEGASHPHEIVSTARELGLAAVALCDRDGLYGSVRAHTAAKQSGQRVIVGAELTVEGDPREGPPGSVALLAMDHDGYANLCGLLTAAHASHEKGTAGILAEQVAASAEGLVAVVPVDARGALPSPALFGPLREAFGDRLCVATWRHRDGFDAARLRAAQDAEARFGALAVATARPLYHHPQRKPLADILHCVRHKTTLDAAGTRLAPNAEAYLRSGERMLTLFRDRPELVHRTVDVAERCGFSLGELRYAFPSDTLCAPGETANEALRRLVAVGEARRYPGGTPSTVRTLIDRELVLIAKLEVAPYFLSVHQIVDMARGKGILCQGRGSAANSAVCYALGVTAVDPSRIALLFERFLSAERHEPPDIDVDFEHERREEVIQAIYEHHGRDRAAMVSEIIAYRGKSALREVGKVFGLSQDQVDRLSGLVIHMDPQSFSAARVTEAGLDPEDERLRQVVHWAGEMEGFPRHLSIHVGGFVLSSEPLTRVAPIEPARMKGRTVIPWDKDDLDDLGFFKIDVLALGMLTAIRKALALLHEAKARAADAVSPAAPFDPIEALAHIPAEVPHVYAAIQRADVIGVFQIESRVQMSMLPRLLPASYYDLVVQVAIVRPGPIQGGMVHPYLRRRAGKERPEPPHECLRPILDRTLGVPLFQEQVMQIAMVGAGYSAGEADQLRRDMAGWRKTGRLERHRDKLLLGFDRRGISRAFGEQLYQQIHGFGEYGFPESHAASFALLVYASAWIKTYHPAEFACALLNAQPMGFYSASSIVKDAQRHGVEVRPPCVLQSDWDCTLEPPAPAPTTTAPPPLRLGLRQIRGFGEGVAKAVMKARGPERAFATLRDLVQRAGLRKNEIEALAEAGALAAIVPARREALFRARAPREGGLFEGLDLEPDQDVGLPPLPRLTQLALDYGRVGLSIDDHPVAHLREALAARGVRRADELGRIDHGSLIAVAGLVIGRQRPGTASGITFFTLEDETGFLNLIVRRDVFAANYAVARHAQLLFVKGRLERQGAVTHVVALELSRLTLPDGEQPNVRSRDFH
jgi:error-prone DNA polymerase